MRFFHDFPLFLLLLFPFCLRLSKFQAQFFFFFVQLDCIIHIARRYCIFFLFLHIFQRLFFVPKGFLILAHAAHIEAGSGFVDQINSFVRQKTVIDIAVRKFYCRFQGFVTDLDMMIRFIVAAQTFQNRNGLYDRWFFHNYLLETAVKSRIFFHSFTVLLTRRRPNDLNFTT